MVVLHLQSTAWLRCRGMWPRVASTWWTEERVMCASTDSKMDLSDGVVYYFGQCMMGQTPRGASTASRWHILVNTEPAAADVMRGAILVYVVCLEWEEDQAFV